MGLYVLKGWFLGVVMVVVDDDEFFIIGVVWNVLWWWCCLICMWFIGGWLSCSVLVWWWVRLLNMLMSLLLLWFCGLSWFGLLNRNVFNWWFWCCFGFSSWLSMFVLLVLCFWLLLWWWCCFCCFLVIWLIGWFMLLWLNMVGGWWLRIGGYVVIGIYDWLLFGSCVYCWGYVL